MTRLLFSALGLPLLLVSGPVPADNPPPIPYAPVAPDIHFTPAPPPEVPYTVAPPGVLLQPAPVAPRHELPMVIVQVDPSKYPIVMSQGVPGHYPMTIVPVPAGQMDAPATTIPYQQLRFVAPDPAKPLKLLITPLKPGK